MKATVKLYTSDKGKTDVYPVKVVVTHQKKIKRKTIGYSLKSDWDFITGLPKPSHDDFEQLYIKVVDIKKKAILSVFKAHEDLQQALNYLLDKPLVRSDDFYAFAESYIESLRKQGRIGTARSYNDTLNIIKKFALELTFDDITGSFIEDFKIHKRIDGIRNTSLKKYLAEFRVLYNAAVRRNFCKDKQPFKGVFHDVRVRVRRLKNRYLTKDQLRKLVDADLQQQSYQRAVDLSLLQFYLCGLDLVDVYYLKVDQVYNNRVILQRAKLGLRGYEFDVKLFEQARKIMLKYGDFDGEYVFPWKKNHKSYKTFRDNHRRDLKKAQQIIGVELQPKGEALTSKVMRHTFATLGKFERIEEDLLRELMGHERNDIDTAYKDKYPQKERDHAQMKVIMV